MNNPTISNARKQQLEEWRQKKANQHRPPTSSTSAVRAGARPPTSEHKSRQALNQTKGNFVSKMNNAPGTAMKIFGQSISFNNSGVAAAATNNQTSVWKTQVKGRLEQEVDLIYSLYKKSVEMNQKGMSQQLKNGYDADKWKKKFVMVFNREKVIEFTASGTPFPFELKHLTGKPKSANKEGKKILQTCAKFWVVFSKLISEKVLNSIKEEVKEELLESFKGSPDYSLLYQEIGSLYDLPEFNESDDKENQPQQVPSHDGTALFEDVKQDLEGKFDLAGEANNEEFQEPVFQQQQEIADQNLQGVVPKQAVESFSNPTFAFPAPDDYPQVNLIPPPSQEYVVRAPVEMTHASINSTPAFKERMAFNQSKSHVEQVEEYKMHEEINDQMKGLNFNSDTKESPQPEQEDPLPQQEVAMEDQGQVIEFQSNFPQHQPAQIYQQQEQQQQESVVQQNEEQMQNKEEVMGEQEPAQQQFAEVMQEELAVQGEQKLEEVAPPVQAEEEFERMEVEEVVVPVENKAEFQQVKQSAAEEEKVASYEEQDHFESTHNEPTFENEASKTNRKKTTKKRKRSVTPPSPTTTMTLRSRYKKVRREEEPSAEAKSDPSSKSEQLTQKSSEPHAPSSSSSSSSSIEVGSSYFRYEIIEKRGGKFLVPVRYSIRHRGEQQEAELERMILDHDEEFEYTPNQNESLFGMDRTTSEIQKFLKSKSKMVTRDDIGEVLVADIGRKGNFSLIKIKEEHRDKYGGNDQVITSLRRLSTSPTKAESYLKEMLQDVRSKKMRELMVTEANDEAREFIRRGAK